jgi:hypothetical protein
VVTVHPLVTRFAAAVAPAPVGAAGGVWPLKLAAPFNRPNPSKAINALFTFVTFKVHTEQLKVVQLVNPVVSSVVNDVQPNQLKYSQFVKGVVSSVVNDVQPPQLKEVQLVKGVVSIVVNDVHPLQLK